MKTMIVLSLLFLTACDMGIVEVKREKVACKDRKRITIPEEGPTTSVPDTTKDCDGDLKVRWGE